LPGTGNYYLCFPLAHVQHHVRSPTMYPEGLRSEDVTIDEVHQETVTFFIIIAPIANLSIAFPKSRHE